MRNIFDLSDTSDLPPEVRPKKTGPKEGSGCWEQLILLAGGPVSSKQLRAAFYRTSREIPNRKSSDVVLCTLVKKGRVVRLKRGVYCHRDNLVAQAAE